MGQLTLLRKLSQKIRSPDRESPPDPPRPTSKSPPGQWSSPKRASTFPGGVGGSSPQPTNPDKSVLGKQALRRCGSQLLSRSSTVTSRHNRDVEADSDVLLITRQQPDPFQPDSMAPSFFSTPIHSSPSSSSATLTKSDYEFSDLSATLDQFPLPPTAVIIPKHIHHHHTPSTGAPGSAKAKIFRNNSLPKYKINYAIPAPVTGYGSGSAGGAGAGSESGTRGRDSSCSSGRAGSWGSTGHQRVIDRSASFFTSTSTSTLVPSPTSTRSSPRSYSARTASFSRPSPSAAYANHTQDYLEGSRSHHDAAYARADRRGRTSAPLPSNPTPAQSQWSHSSHPDYGASSPKDSDLYRDDHSSRSHMKEKRTTRRHFRVYPHESDYGGDYHDYGSNGDGHDSGEASLNSSPNSHFVCDDTRHPATHVRVGQQQRYGTGTPGVMSSLGIHHPDVAWVVCGRGASGFQSR